MDFELNEDQQRAKRVLDGGHNTFLTGEAGTGKSVTLSAYADTLDERIPILASTGAAAVLVGGRTFHSFFGLGICQGPDHAVVTRAVSRKKIEENLQETDAVIIDEVSMLSGRVFSLAERIAQTVRGNSQPWGGLRIIAVGDFAQLPPVEDGVRPDGLRDWAFLHPVWRRSGFRVAYLRKVMRTDNAPFLAILNKVRRGQYDREVYNFLLERFKKDVSDDFEGTRLFPRRDDVDTHNNRCLHRLPGDVKYFPTVYTGEGRVVAQFKRNLPIPDVLMLKEGALVMIRKNATDLSFVNGTLAKVAEIKVGEYGARSVKVRLIANEREVTLAPTKYQWFDEKGKEAASATNLPLSLAWACSIHKAQGATLDRICVELRGLWEPGQAYVALSRARHPDGISVTGWQAESFRADPYVTAYYRRFEERAAEEVA